MAKPSRSPAYNLSDFEAWLGSLDLGVVPSLHVNGAAFSHAVLAVDFGSPLKQIRLPQDVANELYTRIIDATRRVTNIAPPEQGARQNIRVAADLSRGIYWSAIA